MDVLPTLKSFTQSFHGLALSSNRRASPPSTTCQRRGEQQRMRTVRNAKRRILLQPPCAVHDAVDLGHLSAAIPCVG